MILPWHPWKGTTCHLPDSESHRRCWPHPCGDSFPTRCAHGYSAHTTLGNCYLTQCVHDFQDTQTACLVFTTFTNVDRHSHVLTPSSAPAVCALYHLCTIFMKTQDVYIYVEDALQLYARHERTSRGRICLRLLWQIQECKHVLHVRTSYSRRCATYVLRK